MARALILHNPAARNAPEPVLLRVLVRELRLAGFAAETRASRAPGEMPALARAAAAEGIERVVVCGGDGSVREAAEGLKGTAVPLAIVPLGTANVLAREMGLPSRRPEACAAVAARGRERRVGLGSVNGMAFTFCASAGLDSQAVDRVDLLEKRQTGGWAYVHAALTALVEGGSPRLAVILDDGRRLAAVQVFATRARRYGGPFVLSAHARLEAPTVRLLVMAPPLSRGIGLPARLLAGGLDGAPGVTSLEVQAFRLEAAAPFPVQADGDIVARTPARFGSEPDALTLVFPP